MPRQIKQYINSMTVGECAALALMAYKNKLLGVNDAEFINRVEELFNLLQSQNICFESPIHMCMEMSASLDNAGWHTMDDFLAWCGTYRKEGPAFFRARRYFRERCNAFGITIDGYAGGKLDEEVHNSD